MEICNLILRERTHKSGRGLHALLDAFRRFQVLSSRVRGFLGRYELFSERFVSSWQYGRRFTHWTLRVRVSVPNVLRKAVLIVSTSGLLD